MNKPSNESDIVFFGSGNRQKVLAQLTKMMEKAINKFEYEKAMVFKEQIRKLRRE